MRRTRSRPVLAAASLLGALAPACAVPSLHDEVYVGGGPSVLPNFGASVEVGQVFHRDADATWSFEVEGTYQPLDDKDFADADDTNPPAGDYTQIQAGVKIALDPLYTRHWTYRLGATWERAEGEPNILQEEGDHVGGFFGFGFETEVTEHLAMGPEISMQVVVFEGDNEVYFLPQLVWHFLWLP